MNASGLPLSFLTGVTFGTLDKTPPHTALSGDMVSVVGFSGAPMILPVTQPLEVAVGKQTMTHPFVIASTMPANLLGCDLLVKLGARILCSPDRLIVSLPDGQTHTCGNVHGQFMLKDDTTQVANIFWERLTSPPEQPGTSRAFLQSWKPWLLKLHPYVPPSNPLHVTPL